MIDDSCLSMQEELDEVTLIFEKLRETVAKFQLEQMEDVLYPSNNCLQLVG